MSLRDGAVPGPKQLPGGRLRTAGREDIKVGSPVGEPSGIGDGQKDESKHLRQQTGVTAADAFPNAK